MNLVFIIACNYFTTTVPGVFVVVDAFDAVDANDAAVVDVEPWKQHRQRFEALVFHWDSFAACAEARCYLAVGAAVGGADAAN